MSKQESSILAIDTNSGEVTSHENMSTEQLVGLSIEMLAVNNGIHNKLITDRMICFASMLYKAGSLDPREVSMNIINSMSDVQH